MPTAAPFAGRRLRRAGCVQPRRWRPGGGIGGAAAAVLLAFTLPLSGQPVYKSIGPNGEVIYSSRPPETGVPVDRIELDPGPSAEAQAAAEARMREMAAQAERMAAARTSDQRKQQQRRVEEARDAVAEAQAALEEAKKRDDPSDWQTLAGGGRVPSAAYQQRLEAAEQRLRKARQRLERARRGAAAQSEGDDAP